jgi:Na+-transporting NADH:ubiquinone oxidoreductase subunit A
VSGEIVDIIRGPKRVIEEIRILSDSSINYHSFGKASPKDLSQEEVKAKLLESGCWAFVQQRPFSIVADPADTPKSIFVSGFDSAPLGVDYNHLVENEKGSFQAGLEVLKRLTEGKVHLNLDANALNSETFTSSKGVEITNFNGAHPAGNVGVQIHHLDSIRKGDVVWTVNPYDLVIIGRLFNEGVYNTEKAVVIAGSEVRDRAYFNFRIGANIDALVKDNIISNNVRIISGNVLTGEAIAEDGFLGFYDYQITAIPEGNEPEFLGWLFPTYARPSISRTLFSFLQPNKEFEVNTNPHGERRAQVFYGEYEKVLPMDLFPSHLLNKCMAETIDIEALEKLGIYELAKEDLALCEFVCTSKIPVQKYFQEALDLVRLEA